MNCGLLKFKRKDGEHVAAYSMLRPTLADLQKTAVGLSADERQYYNSLRVDRRMKTYLGGRFAAKKAVSMLVDEPDFTQIHIGKGVFDYPVVDYPYTRNIQVSISHTNDIMIAIAFFEMHPVSVDIEQIITDKEQTIRSTILSEELKLFENELLSDIEKLTLLWTMKEALSKIIRTGMMTDFSLFEIQEVKREHNSFVCAFRHFHQYKVVSVIVADHACSLVVPRLSDTELVQFHNYFTGIVSAQTIELNI